MDPNLVGLSRTLDAALIGRRLRNARLAAGLTQSQATDGEVSATYLSRIEDGQRRASVALLERLAERLGVSVESLLAPSDTDATAELRLALDHAELQFAGGDAAGALVASDALIGQVDRSVAASELRAAVRFLRARTLEAVGNYNEAILELEDLTSTPAADPAWVKAAIALTRCYRQVGDTVRAIQAGDTALDNAKALGLEGSTEAIQLAVTIASAYAVSGNTDHALRMCLRALESAETHGSSPVASASAYWNASMIEHSRGNVASATDYAKKALAIFEVADDNRALSVLRTSAAELHLDADPADPAAAIEQLSKAQREMAWAASTDADKANLLAIKARAHLMLGEVDLARENLDQVALVVPSSAMFIRANAASLAGQVAASLGRTSEARDRYLEGIHLLSEVAADRRVSNLWYELAELLDEAGDAAASRDAFRAAAAASGATSTRRAMQPR